MNGGGTGVGAERDPRRQEQDGFSRCDPAFLSALPERKMRYRPGGIGARTGGNPHTLWAAVNGDWWEWRFFYYSAGHNQPKPSASLSS